MMNHLPQELISQWLDRELDPQQAASVREHLESCELCRSLEQEMAQVNRVFRSAGALELPPYLWTRIAAHLNEEKRTREQAPSWLSWLQVPIWSTVRGARFRALIWAPAAILLVAVSSLIIFTEHQSALRTRAAAIAEIDRAHVALLAASNINNNPFQKEKAVDPGINPFSQGRLSDPPNPFRSLLDRQ